MVVKNGAPQDEEHTPMLKSEKKIRAKKVFIISDIFSWISEWPEILYPSCTFILDSFIAED